MAIRAVVFDIGGVLEINGPMDFTVAWESTLGLATGEIGERLADVWLGGSVGTISEDDVRAAIGERLALPGDQVDRMMADMWGQYLGVANEELIEYVRILRPRYRTGILSNSFVGAREREQAAYGFETLVDDLVYSHEVGMNKPDARIFELTCARLEVDPGEVVFVDNVESHVEAARESGINGVHFHDNAQAIVEIQATIAARADD
jgi:putative hydrolase of the HAD superfamily